MTPIHSSSMHTPTQKPPEPASAILELAELARAQAQATLQKIPMLGAVTWLMLQQSALRAGLLGDLEWRVVPPLMLGQARLFMRGEAPVGYASWALLSEDAASRWRQPPHRLALQDWNSGEQAWLIDVFTPFGGAREMLQELRATHLGGRDLHQLLPTSPLAGEELLWPAVCPEAREDPGTSYPAKT